MGAGCFFSYFALIGGTIVRLRVDLGRLVCYSACGFTMIEAVNALARSPTVRGLWLMLLFFCELRGMERGDDFFSLPLSFFLSFFLFAFWPFRSNFLLTATLSIHPLQPQQESSQKTD